MRDGQGYEVLHNGVPRTFRDKRETALEAAQFAKSRAKGTSLNCATAPQVRSLWCWWTAGWA